MKILVLILASSLLIDCTQSFLSRGPVARPKIGRIDAIDSWSNAAKSRWPETNHVCFETALFSLKNLVEDISASNEKKTIFVGGKGGVGKTTTSSALAVQLAIEGNKVLIISSDPAHSLGDALDEDLRGRSSSPVMLTDVLTGGRLHAAEVDAEAGEFLQTQS